MVSDSVPKASLVPEYVLVAFKGVCVSIIIGLQIRLNDQGSTRAS